MRAGEGNAEDCQQTECEQRPLHPLPAAGASDLSHGEELFLERSQLMRRVALAPPVGFLG